MLSRAKKVSRDVAKLPSVPKEPVAHFLTGPMTGAAIEMAGVAFKKALEAALTAELIQHLGYASGADRPDDATNQRNGSTSKTVLTGDGMVRIETPRDRSFEPLLVPKHARGASPGDRAAPAAVIGTCRFRGKGGRVLLMWVEPIAGQRRRGPRVAARPVRGGGQGSSDHFVTGHGPHQSLLTSECLRSRWGSAWS
jgi:hypothetical protein